MKLIDAEAAVRTIQALCGGRRDDAHVCDNCRDAIEGIRSLPAAVPVCDVEKALTVLASADLTHPDTTRAILSAGYAGSVRVEDVREIATIVAQDDKYGPKAQAIAKRLLAATEGK